MKGQLSRLKALAEILSETELLHLRQMTEARRRIEAERAALSAPHPRKEDPGTSPADLAGAPAKWRVWRDARLRALNIQEARVAAETETRRQAAARAFGRAQVLRDLEEKSLRR